MTDENMRVWNQVCKTAPEHTKEVTQRGGFTSICAQYTIQRATEVFGPVGIGWGYDVEYKIEPELIFAFVTIWHGSRENKYGPVLGCNQLRTGTRIDDDAPKKAMTDALTKGLSHLGFSADVFLGMYDDNKYVNTLKAESVKKTKPAAAPGAPTWPRFTHTPGVMLLGKLKGRPIKEMGIAPLQEAVEGAKKILGGEIIIGNIPLAQNESGAVELWIVEMVNQIDEMGGK